LVPVMLYLSENLKLRIGIQPKHKFDHPTETSAETL
jgi:hypothetical protein